MAGFRPSILFIYGLVLTLLAFIYRDPFILSIVAIPNFVVGFILGWRRFKILLILFLLGFIGLFLNAYLVSNTGEAIIVWGPMVVREGVIEALTIIGLRLATITGGTMIFLSLSDPYETIKYLESDLYIPKGISFSIFYALRLLPLIQREAREVQNIRVERGYRRFLISPSDFKSFILPLLSIFIERAYWTGVAAELRGFQLRKRRKIPFKLSSYDYLILLLIIIQVLAPILLNLLLISIGIRI